MQEIKKSNDPLREKPLVYINFTFSDDYRTYKEFRMVASHSILRQTAITCKKLKKDQNYKHSIYNETINLAFRPRVLLKDLCNSVVKYICCYIDIKDLLSKYSETGIQICAHFNVMNNDWSQVYILPPEIYARIQNIDPEFNLVSNSELSMTLPSKFTFLNESESKFLNRIFDKINESKKDMIEMTYGDLWDLIYKDSANEEPDKYELEAILYSLTFYGFLAIKEDEDGDVYRLSIKDLPHYYEFLQQNDVKISA